MTMTIHGVPGIHKMCDWMSITTREIRDVAYSILPLERMERQPPKHGKERLLNSIYLNSKYNISICADEAVYVVVV